MTSLLLVTLFACNKEEGKENKSGESTLHLCISNLEDYLTRTSYQTPSELPTETNDKKINTLEVFIFHNTGGASNNGKLDVYKKFSEEEVQTLSDLSVKTTTGNKYIYIIANSHITDWRGITTHTLFQSQISQAIKENFKDFTMVGSATQNLTVSSTVTISLSKIVSRIEVRGIKTSFSGTPYEGKTLSEAKLYLINASGEKRIYNGSDPSTIKVLNSKHLLMADVSSCQMTGMLFDSISGDIGEGADAYSKRHLFHCYENTIPVETQENRFTKVVLEAKLDGTLYYYPIAINREGFGYVAGIKGVQRNYWYLLDITILRPGSLDPDTILEKGSANITITVLNWDKVDSGDQIF